MPKLLRPPIPVEVKCRVVLRQLGEMFIDMMIEAHRANRKVAPLFRCTHGKLLTRKLADLAELLGCEVKELRLDHNPALGARRKIFKRGVHVGYDPPANDPAHLEYRPHGKRFARSHLIKTNVRGERGQHPDRVLIVKNRKVERDGPARPLSGAPKRKRRSAARPKRKSRPLRSANRWPAKGSQKFRRKPR